MNDVVVLAIAVIVLDKSSFEPVAPGQSRDSGQSSGTTRYSISHIVLRPSSFFHRDWSGCVPVIQPLKVILLALPHTCCRTLFHSIVSSRVVERRSDDDMFQPYSRPLMSLLDAIFLILVITDWAKACASGCANGSRRNFPLSLSSRPSNEQHRRHGILNGVSSFSIIRAGHAVMLSRCHAVRLGIAFRLLRYRSTTVLIADPGCVMTYSVHRAASLS